MSKRINKGACYFCGEPVYASEGQIITFAKKVAKRSGEVVARAPTHKRCRKDRK